MKQTPQPKTCPWGQHQWRDRDSALRAGWLATDCRVCGKFLGRRPANEYPKNEYGQRGPGGTWRE